ncbi:MAG: hypothetical protein ACRDOP_07260 [Gaiellaceae bacterium]
MDRDAEATQAVFRRANEGIFAFAREVLGDGPDTVAPFLCECADRRCTHIVRLTPAEFEAASSVEGQFVVLPGHEGRMHGEDVVERGERFTLVSRTMRERSRS